MAFWGALKQGQRYIQVLIILVCACTIIVFVWSQYLGMHTYLGMFSLFSARTRTDLGMCTHHRGIFTWTYKHTCLLGTISDPVSWPPFFGLNLPKKVSVKTTATCEAKKQTCPTCFENCLQTTSKKVTRLRLLESKNLLVKQKKVTLLLSLLKKKYL